MPDNDADFLALMERVVAGSPEAAREFTEVYGPSLLLAVRRRLNQHLRPKFDSLDFVQDVWVSFFAELPRGLSFRSPAELVSFLDSLARNKVVEAVRKRLLGQKYNVNREQPLEDLIRNQSRAPEARQPTPSEVAMGREEWEQLLQRQPPVYRRMLLLLHEGKTPAAVAQEIGITERTVRRVTEKVAPWLMK
jgi:RNA polymerase sigma-70 factor (ECF subfamily)